MDSNEIRQSFLSFFEKRGHKIIPSSSLIPDDPSVLFTTAGMQQFKKYFTGELDAEKDFGTKNVASIQKCFRTSDIDEVGDESHLTFFEMLGNFSFGGYWKKEAIEYAYEFITKELDLKIDYVSVFKGSGDIPPDNESEKIWKLLGISKIEKRGEKDNLWGPTGQEGPFGPTTEIYINGIEVWNIVFNQYYKRKIPEQKPGDRTIPPGVWLEELKIKGVDTGMGLERLAMVVQNKPTIFETDLFTSIIPDGGLPTIMDGSIKKIMLDHCRAMAFLISDGVRPSNKEQGYILRRIMRRAMAHFHKSSIGSFSWNDILGQDFIDIENILIEIVKYYRNYYSKLNQDKIIGVFREENSKFRQMIISGMRELKKIEILDSKSAFKLFESYGLTFEIIKDFAGEKAKNLTREDFDKEFEKHQEISRAGAEKKFGGHGLVLDTGELKAGSEEEKQKVIRLHTATHLLHQALRDVLGNEVSQRGSDITPERTRFDFVFSRKMTPEEIKKVEDIVNEKIGNNLPVKMEKMPKEEAEKTGALHFFKGKYPDEVSVYYVGDSLGNAYSKEFCGGPHVSNTGEIGKFKITKEESSSAGIRRIRATVS